MVKTMKTTSGVYFLLEFPLPGGGGKNQSILLCREENQTNLVIES